MLQSVTGEIGSPIITTGNELQSTDSRIFKETCRAL